MGTKTWQNGGVDNNWSTAGNWAEGSKPINGDDVVMSAAYNCVVNEATALLKSFDMTGYTNTLSGSNQIEVSGATGTTNDVKFAGTVTWTGSLRLNPTGTAILNLYSNGKLLNTTIFQGSSAITGTVNLQENLSCYRLSLRYGTFTSNGYSITCSLGIDTSGIYGTRTIDISNSTVTLSGVGDSMSSPWYMVASDLTLVTTGSTISMSAAGISFYGADKTYNTVTFTGGGQITVNGGNTFSIFNCTGTAIKNCTLIFQNNQTITGTLNIDGNSIVNRILVSSQLIGIPKTLTITGATISGCSNVDFRDITFANGGSNVDFSGITGGSGDCGGNSISGGGTLSFTASTNQHWVNTDGGNWSTTANWTSRIPLPQDDCTFDCAFGTSKTVTFDSGAPIRSGRNIDWSSASFTTSLTWSLIAFTFYGNMTLKTGMTVSGNELIQISLRGTSTWRSNGVLFGQGNLNCSGYSGTLTLLDDFTMQGNLYLASNISFNTGNFAVSVYTFSVGNDSNVTLGTSTLTFSSTGSTWSANTTGTVSANLSTMLITNTSSNLKIFNGGGKTYGNLSITGGGSSSGYVLFIGNNTFNNFTINAPKTVKIQNGNTQTINGIFTALGTVTDAITLCSSSAPLTAYFYITNPWDNVAYVVATDIDSASGSTIYNPNGTNTRTVNWNTSSSSSSSRSSSSSSRSSSSSSSQSNTSSSSSSSRSSSSSSSSCRSSSSSSSSRSSSSSSCRSSSSSSSSSCRSSSSSSCRSSSSSSSSSSCRSSSSSSSSSSRSSSSSSSSCRSSSSSSSSSSSLLSSSSSSSSCRSSSSSSSSSSRSSSSSSSSCRSSSSSSSSSCRSSSSSSSSSSCRSSSSSSSSSRSSSSSSSRSSSSSSSSRSSSSSSSSSTVWSIYDTGLRLNTSSGVVYIAGIRGS